MTTEAKRGFYNGLGQAVGLTLAGLLGVAVGALLFGGQQQPKAPTASPELLPMPTTAPVLINQSSSAQIIPANCRGW